MKKKGVEMGLNTIVTAVIALMVLVVLTVVFAGRFGMFGKEVSNCETAGNGVCVNKGTCTSATSVYGGRVIDFKCTNTAQECCFNSCTLAGGQCDTPCSADKEISADCNNGKQCCPKTK